MMAQYPLTPFYSAGRIRKIMTHSFSCLFYQKKTIFPLALYRVIYSIFYDLTLRFSSSCISAGFLIDPYHCTCCNGTLFCCRREYTLFDRYFSDLWYRCFWYIWARKTWTRKWWKYFELYFMTYR